MAEFMAMLDPEKDVKSFSYVAAATGQSVVLRPDKPEMVDDRDWSRLRHFCVVVDTGFKPLQQDEIRVITPDGIGDLHWVFLKLGALKKASKARTLKLFLRRINARPDRCMPFAEMNPIVDEVTYVNEDIRWPALGIEVLNGEEVYDYKLNPNVILERGESIETWIPELPAEYDYKLDFQPGSRYDDLAVVYPGDSKAERIWADRWGSAQWAAMIAHMKDFAKRIVIVGMECDRQKVDDIMSLGVPAQNLVGKTTWEQALQLVCRARVSVCSVSGLPIVGAFQGANTVVFWPGIDAPQALPVAMRTSWIKDKPGYTPVGYDVQLAEAVTIFEEKWRSGGDS